MDTSRTLEYRWYVKGCQRLDREPIPHDEFCRVWQIYEDHAESLKAADRSGTLTQIDPIRRVEMERRIQDDAILKAVLVGQAEETEMPGRYS